MTQKERVVGADDRQVDRRAQILDAAQSLVAEKGFAAASVRAVASRAGIGASTMRYWFPSQEVLTTAIAERALALEISDKRIADRSLPPADRLTECMAQFLPADEGHRGQGEGWFALIAAAVGPAATTLGAAMYRGMLATTRGRLCTWLEILSAEGFLRHENIPLTATALLTRIDGLTLGLILPGTSLDVATAHTILRNDVRNALAPPSPAVTKDS